LLALVALSACDVFRGTTPTATLPAAAATATQPAAAATETSAPPAATTAAPAPTETPVPPTETATPEPSPSPSPIGPTPTNTVPPTPDPNEGVGDIVYQDALDGSGGWYWTFSDQIVSFGVDLDRRQLKGVMAQPNAGWRFTISPDTLRLGNQQARVTAHTAACGENDEYGLMFRGSVDAEDNYSLYLFKLRCGGAARIDLLRGPETTVLVDWTPSPAIQAGAPADNTLMVWMAGGEFRFYVNDQYLFSAQDSALTEGFFGLYMYDRTAGGMTIYYEDLMARAVTR
jgi:hypothetical protein